MRWSRHRSGFPALTADTDVLDTDLLRPLIDEHLAAGRPAGWFEPAYGRAVAQRRRLPWQEGAPHPWVQSWLADPVHRPPGRRALLLGCGDGEDTTPLLAAGLEVTALDIAPTALAWARARAHARGEDGAVRWVEADLLDVPSELAGAFDLVVEVHTVPWLPGVVRDAAMAAVGGLLAVGGVALVITAVTPGEEHRAAAAGPPWSQAPSELAAYRAGGLVRLALEHPPALDGAALEVRMTWQRAAGAPVVTPGALPIH